MQLDGTVAGMRARELDRSARRDVAATLKREGAAFSGIDLWVPERHFVEAAHVDRAVRAVSEACGLAGEVARLTEAGGVTVCVTLPAGVMPAVVSEIGAAARARVWWWPTTAAGRRRSVVGWGLIPRLS
ncbi:MAG: hypothetical protein QM783_08570 [Phycisphaerales bacterium]